MRFTVKKLTLPHSGRIYLCGVGACPYFEFNQGQIILYDDLGKVKIESTKDGIKITIPKEYIEELLKNAIHQQ
ncbi:hypothetical protein [Thermococcus sp. MAR1]|uniref:hypothetical protein n=1 Tax=Thermococcus sp. MAR1 TaxID=1638263 RepID=UPI00143AA2C8|nr:hypothetical protein [Thermococcus sp. MAR1]NJE11304.1 hypothetical protein [Thermococcus sp. MAR1]